MKIIDFFFPYVKNSTPEELEQSENERSDEIKKIEQKSWGSATSVALEEARRIAEEEDRRRLNSESKASTILMVTMALIPLLTYMETNILSNETGLKELNLITGFIFFIAPFAVFYVVMTLVWAFESIKVRNYNRLGATDLVNVWDNNSNIIEELISKTLITTIKNQDTINYKVTANKMAYYYLLRGVITFSLAFALQVIW